VQGELRLPLPRIYHETQTQITNPTAAADYPELFTNNDVNY